jgi:predicted DNA-binding transcriptional regulator AlpA
MDDLTEQERVLEPPEQERVLVQSKVVRRRAGNISDVTLWRWVKRGTFPPPDKIINGRNYWWNSTINDWEAA